MIGAQAQFAYALMIDGLDHPDKFCQAVQLAYQATGCTNVVLLNSGPIDLFGIQFDLATAATDIFDQAALTNLSATLHSNGFFTLEQSSVREVVDRDNQVPAAIAFVSVQAFLLLVFNVVLCARAMKLR